MSQREPTDEELEALEIIQRGAGAFRLVPVRYCGEYRYALGVEQDVGTDGQVIRIVALLIEHDSDKDKFETDEVNNLDLN
jgi:hypothetical protein